jgi:hypothetical protein
VSSSLGSLEERVEVVGRNLEDRIFSLHTDLLDQFSEASTR